MNIEKFSNAVWTAVGLAIGVLALLGVLVGVVSAGMAFYKYNIHKVPGVAVKAGNENGKGGLKLTVQYEVPLGIEGLEYSIVPVKLEKKKSEEEMRDSLSESSHKRSASLYDSGEYGGYASEAYGRFWGPYYNLVFVNKKTGESRTLLEDKGFIQEIYFPGRKYDPKEGEPKPTFLLYRIAFTDTNGDGLVSRF